MRKLVFIIFILLFIDSGDCLLKEVAVFYEREIDKTLRIMVSLLEPVIILIMGLAVGFVVFAMLMPIFEMNLLIK